MTAQAAVGDVAAQKAAWGGVGGGLTGDRRRGRGHTIGAEVVASVDVAAQDARRGVVDAVLAARTALGHVAAHEAARAGGGLARAAAADGATGKLPTPSPPWTRPRRTPMGEWLPWSRPRRQLWGTLLCARLQGREGQGGGGGGVRRRGRGHGTAFEVVALVDVQDASEEMLSRS